MHGCVGVVRMQKSQIFSRVEVQILYTSELTVYRMLILFIVILERRLFSLLGVDMSDIYLTTCTVPQSNFPF